MGQEGNALLGFFKRSGCLVVLGSLLKYNEFHEPFKFVNVFKFPHTKPHRSKGDTVQCRQERWKQQTSAFSGRVYYGYLKKNLTF